tara:strand:+ start:65 stop:583 length:519 start_codon:yes stop_codon:yes gene_type:complete
MSSPTESTTEQMVSLIDNIKGDIPDQKYIEIMDKLKELHNVKKTYKYLITYIDFETIALGFQPNDYDDSVLQVKVIEKKHTELVELNEILHKDHGTGSYQSLGKSFKYCIHRGKLEHNELRETKYYSNDDIGSVSNVYVEKPNSIIINIQKVETCNIQGGAVLKFVKDTELD